MDTYLAIASKRDDGSYADRPIPDDVVTRLLDAGRLAGSAKNRQRWRFLVVDRRDLLDRLSGCVYEPDNLLGAPLAVALVGSGFDLGRCAQNMMLAAWNDGVTSSPNGLADPDAARELLGLGPDDALGTVLSFGYPASGRSAEDRPAHAWTASADRKPLDEVVERL